MKYLVSIAAIASLSAIIYGLYLPDEAAYKHQFLGFGTAALFLVVMPLFIFSRRKGRSMRDYMLTKENLEEMRQNERGNE